ncbi:MAG: serine hydrolase domain-containing protein [Saprospiraceae bacterium]
MKFLKFIFKAILSFLSVSVVNAQGAKSDGEDLLQKHIAHRLSAGITAGYASSDSILWLGYEGYADKKAKKRVDSLTRFRTASIAKPITAVAALQLYEQGKLDLDSPISSYIPDFPIKGGDSITARHLLQNSSGIGAYEGNEWGSTTEYPTLRDAMRVFESRDLLFKPGTEYFYTSYGYVALGWVIEQVSGQTYEDYITEHIFTPAGMLHTGVEKFTEPFPELSELYDQKNSDPHKARKRKNKLKRIERGNLSNRTPGGGFYSTAQDLLKFGQAILNKQLLSEETMNMMWTDSGIKKEGNPYGLGWFLYGENPQYGQVYGHSGGQSGASSQLMILPKEDVVIVVLSNTSNVWEQVFGLSVNFFGVAAKGKP